MMKTLSKLLIVFVVISMLAGCLTACDVVNSLLGKEVEQPPVVENPPENPGTQGGEDKPPIEFVDYASQVKFNPNSGRIWAKVEVQTYIDGDTTHFVTIDGTVIEGVDYVKARYLAINTPESTGVVEPWGKKASNYTKTQLMKATEIIIESDTNEWNFDSTGSRHLLWVWYKTATDTEFRNLNLEILQSGLAFGSNVGSNVYSEYALKILNQSKTLKLHVFDKTTKDPDYYYGGAIEVTLKELKANLEKYKDKLVKFEAVVAKKVGSTVYVEEYDAENDAYFGMQVYTGNAAAVQGVFQTIGNRVVVVGTLQYWETGETYQVSNLQYKSTNPNWEGGCRVISSGNSASYRDVVWSDLLDGKMTLDTFQEVKDENGEVIDEILVTEEFSFAELALHSTATLSELTVKSVYTTQSNTDSNGALTITCTDRDGVTIEIRTDTKLTTVVDGQKVDVTAANFPKGTVITVKGIIDFYQGDYQLRVFSYDDITFE